MIRAQLRQTRWVWGGSGSTARRGVERRVSVGRSAPTTGARAARGRAARGAAVEARRRAGLRGFIGLRPPTPAGYKSGRNGHRRPTALVGATVGTVPTCMTMDSSRPTRLILVMAEWCPHCFPLSIELGRVYARQRGVPMETLDIDVPAEELEADRLVREYGDWTDDYLIPQAFLEWSDGRVEHLLTGVPGPIEGTQAAWQKLLASA
jgi:thiol-disulfide isomerase/thioredoxin